jgi:hypothetical protein
MLSDCDLNDPPYISLILDMKGSRPEWVAELSDRAAYSLLREGFSSIDDLQAAVAKGFKISDIHNLARAQIKEINDLLATC